MKLNNKEIEDYECPICFMPMKIPMFFDECEHVFCELCTESLVRNKCHKKRICPICRGKIYCIYYNKIYMKIVGMNINPRLIFQLNENVVYNDLSWGKKVKVKIIDIKEEEVFIKFRFYSFKSMWVKKSSILPNNYNKVSFYTRLKILR